MNAKFVEDDQYQLFPENEDDFKIPYIACMLTPEQAKLIKGKQPEIYSTDGETIFEVKGTTSRKQILFIMFR